MQKNHRVIKTMITIMTTKMMIQKKKPNLKTTLTLIKHNKVKNKENNNNYFLLQ